VPIPIDEVPDAIDNVPSLTPKMTVASDSLVVSNILATIACEEVRYIGIVATDLLDTLFLTGLIRQHCPDVQIILLGADLRYTDREFTLDFRGAIVGSSYPLDALHQCWSYPGRGRDRRRLFVTDSDMGCYNAALVLLNAEKQNAEKAGERELLIPAAHAREFVAYGPPSFESDPRGDKERFRPAIWINQVGQQSLWPLKATSWEQVYGTEVAVARKLIPAIEDYQPLKPHPELNLPMFFKLAAFGLSLLGFMLSLLWWSGTSTEHRNRPEWFVSSWVGARKLESPLASWCLSLITGAIAVPSGLMLRAGIVLVRAGVLGDHPWDCFTNGLTLALLGLNLLVLFLVTLNSIPHQGSVLGFLGVVIVVLSVVLVEWVFVTDDHQNERVFFALRDVHLDSGVSPILSVLLFAAGFFSLGCFGLRWLNLRQRLRGSHLIKLSNRPEQSIWGQRLKVILDRSESGVLLANPLVTGSRLWASRALVIIVLAYVWGGRALRAVAPRSDSANFPGFFSILCSVFRDSVVTIFRVIS